MSDSARPHGLQPSRLLCPWDFPGKSTGMGCHRLLRSVTLVDFKVAHVVSGYGIDSTDCKAFSSLQKVLSNSSSSDDVSLLF